eukprot:7809934-Alexandrium_andersonii.AAC.1
MAALQLGAPIPVGLVGRAEASRERARLAARSRRQAEWRRWAQESLANGQGQLCRWIRGGGGSLDADLVPASGAMAGAAAPGSRQWPLALPGGPAAKLRYFEWPWKAVWQGPPAAPVDEGWLEELGALPPVP